MKDLIAYCGLDCEVCEARISTIKDDNALREKVAKEWSELNGVEITPAMINCEGCRAEGRKSVYCESLCPIRKCARKKGAEHCGKCGEMSECERIGMILANNADALRNLKS